nr:unnamed protein product [Callosobruchus analis]
MTSTVQEYKSRIAIKFIYIYFTINYKTLTGYVKFATHNLSANHSILMALHNDCVNGVSLHPYRPILATASGQHHTQDPLHHTRHAKMYENALCMWWLGQQQEDSDIITAIIKAATHTS